MPRKATRAKIQHEEKRIAGKLLFNGVLAMVLGIGPIVYQMLRLPHRMALALAAWGICLLVIGRIVWIATGGSAKKARFPRHRTELSLAVPLAFAFAFGPSPYRTLELPHPMIFALFSWALCLTVIGRIVWLTTEGQGDKRGLSPLVDRDAAIQSATSRDRAVITAAIAGLTYCLIIIFMWSPFAVSSGMSYETGFSYHSETTNWWNGFVEVSDPMRPYTNFFYHISYLIGTWLHIPGSFVPFQFVYACLWWARAFLTFLILRRLIGGYELFCYIAGALVLVHASDLTLQWVGQLNQCGFIFWMLLGIYLLIRAVCSGTHLRIYIWTVLACLSEYLSLWSYESGIFIILLAPVLIALALRRKTTRFRFPFAMWYGVTFLYAYLSINKYLSSAVITYQETVLRKQLGVFAIAGDLIFAVSSSVSFWSWSKGTDLDLSSMSVITLALGALTSFVAGGILLVLAQRRASSPLALIPPRVLWALSGAGAVILLASFPVYLALPRQLWRTQLLSGIGAAIVLTAVSMLIAGYLGKLARAHKWIPPVGSLCLASLVVYTGACRAVERGSAHRVVWETHRRVMARIIRAVPQVRPGTLFALTNVSTQSNPFGDCMWFDLALRLAYPGTTVAGFYFGDDGTPGPGNIFKLTKDKWLVEKTSASALYFSPLFKEAAISEAIVIEDSSRGVRILPKVPPLLCRPGCVTDGYDPETRVIRAAPSPRAINRYGPL